jgi:hypothetical protein
MCAAAVLCAVASAPASVITFENTGGQFDWRPGVVNFPPALCLDITQPASQSGASTPFTISWSRGEEVASDTGVTHELYCGASTHVVKSTTSVRVQLFSNGTMVDLYPPQDFGSAGTVGPGLNWQPGATLGWFFFQFNGDHWIAGSAFSMGLELNMADGTHFGYARFQLTSGTYGLQYQPSDWGYETVPGAPIMVPAPAGVILFAVGLGRCRRRRRQSSRLTKRPVATFG